jgi:alpha-mannosidase
VIRDAKGDCLLDPIFRKGDNFYEYVSDSEVVRDTSYATLTSISVLESGPLMTSYKLDYDAPGFQDFNIEVRLRFMEDYIEIINRANKLKVRSKERGTLNFPLAVKEARIAYEIPGGVVNQETDILPGSNPSFLTIQRFMDLRDDHRGYVFISQDAPIIRVQRSMQQTTLKSVLIDNFWHVNFRASQQGPLCFRYYIKSQEDKNIMAAGKLGLEVFQPLIVLSSQMTRQKFPVLGIASKGIVTTACRPGDREDEYEVRLFNMSPSPAVGTILVNRGSRIFAGKPARGKLKEISNDMLLNPFEIKTVIIRGQ